MLETKNLCKTYKPKKGVPVRALKNVSLKFPDKGMIFLLGKSGSGKSTLLNVLGGLDRYDSGEIIIKGVSSKSFRQMHFDSYRNTYVGFIFQEYNILEDFSVGANIALSIELQGKKASETEINNILNQVDLAGHGQRKPNELSGGQKQRVAIARALVKNPQIIMADEPTGALDSNTGTQVLSTLKKLSKDRLVIVVSHDREFAMQYADRVIELADGEVISDKEYSNEWSQSEANALSFTGDTVQIAAGYRLTPDDLTAINQYLATMSNKSVKLKVSDSPTNRSVKDTDVSKIKNDYTSPFKLIKSKLPLKNAFKMGATGLKFKKFRLVVTIILSCIAFGLFGLVDTFSAYNHINACTTSIIDSNINYASVKKAKKVDEGINEYYQDYGYKIQPEELENISTQMGTQMRGLYHPQTVGLEFDGYFDASTELTKTAYDIYPSSFSGFVEVDSDYLKNSSCTLVAGNLPDGNLNQIAISTYVAEVFKKAKYRDIEAINSQYIKISDYSELIGKNIKLANRTYVITGIVDTSFNLERYKQLIESKDNQTTADIILEYALYNEFTYASRYSLARVAMVGNGHINRLATELPKVSELNATSVRVEGENSVSHINSVGLLKDFHSSDIIWMDSSKRELSEKEIIVSSDFFYEHTPDYPNALPPDFKSDHVKQSVVNNQYSITVYNYFNEDFTPVTINGYKVVGVLDSETLGLFSTAIFSDSFAMQLLGDSYGLYDSAIGAMPIGRDNIKKTISFCFNETEPIRYELKNSVTYELEAVHSILKALSKVFLYIGIGFALFAALMLANFIGISISHKKQEIGILRAIGSRSNDVFRIFFAESFIIAMINFVLSAVSVGFATVIINNIIRQQGILITVLSFGIRQISLLFAVSIVVAFVASFLPVKKIASKRPIDAIKNR